MTGPHRTLVIDIVDGVYAMREAAHVLPPLALETHIHAHPSEPAAIAPASSEIRKPSELGEEQ